MKYLKGLFNFYINSSIHVAIAVYALTRITLIRFNLSYDENSLYFVFFATIVAYNFVKYFGFVKFHHRKLATSLGAIQFLSLVALGAMLFYLARLQSQTFVLIGVLGIITFLYAIPLIPKRLLFDDHRNLREISGIKIYVIALVWTMATVLIPVMNASVAIDSNIVTTMVQRFLFVLVLMLPFEIRDLNYDNLRLATIPQKIGVRNTKIIGVFMLMVFLMLEFLKKNLSRIDVISIVLITAITLVLLVFSNKSQSKYYSAFWVEGLPILWLIVLLMLG
ncbi:UbiA prenyltransferase family protein [Winogradskyella aurantia]|uniref:Prenyltransferase n=1 Tax=Winogradskyella aurantia TaxID=1915063 RepID=A0A265UNI8_9FLAO|nr:hypothetical protein [Winogradskyella aurantia]OZV66894.1 hypothetical protein CA834_13735 [Winogradskyella aurantia]